jgi:hypothetical protein
MFMDYEGREVPVVFEKIGRFGGSPETRNTVNTVL